MSKIKLNFRVVAAIAACLAVTTMFSGCKKGEVDSDDDKTWPSSTVLAHYGLDGLNKPADYSEGSYTEEEDCLVILFKGNSSTNTSIANYFRDSSFWAFFTQTPSGSTVWKKITVDMSYIASYRGRIFEDGDSSFELRVCRVPIE